MAKIIPTNAEDRTRSTSPEAEQAVLAVLLEGGPDSERAWELIRDDFAPDLFESSPAMTELARVIESLYRAGRKVDPVLVTAELERQGLAGTVVPTDFPYALARSIGSAASVRHYLQLLVALRAERRGLALRRDPPAPLLADKLGAALDRIGRRRDGKEKPIPLPPGWPTLMKLLGGGLWPGLYTLVGNTASGKSQFALQIAHYAATCGTPASYIGLELDDLGVVARALALGDRARAGSRMAWSHLYYGQVDSEGFAAAAAAAERFQKLPLHVLTAPPFGWGYEGVLAEAQRMRAQYPDKADASGALIPGSTPFLMVLDFLQLVGGQNAAGRMLELRERIAQASYAARDVARRLNAVVILVSSTARENYTTLDGDEARPGKDGKAPPRLPYGEGDPSRFVGLGKESGEIEFAADCCLVVGRLPGQSGPPPWKMACAVAKVRARSRDAQGLDGWVKMGFDGTFWGEGTAGQGAGASWYGGGAEEDDK
jgi:replicative DNA helicase